MRQATHEALSLTARYIRHAFLVCLGWTAFFALCGLIAALATDDWDFMKAYWKD